jgi:hypothetical protein
MNQPMTVARINQSKVISDRIDQLEVEMIDNFPAVACPLNHLFAKGMYIRQVFIPAGTLVTSKIHKTQHPFTISKGKVMVNEGEGQWFEAFAPFTGITEPGTRRIVFAVEDTIWTTYHAFKSITGEENILSIEEKEAIADMIESKIIKPHVNKALTEIKRTKICHL